VIALLAHLTPTGYGAWADGMARLLLQPTELLLVIALVLLAVQSGRASADRVLWLLPLAWLLGGLIGLHLSAELLQAVACTAMVAATGLLVALGVRLRARVLLPSVALLATGFALVAGSALAGHPGALAALLGETVAIAVLTTLLGQLLAPPHPRWRAIAVRVGGSWITAASLLMFGWLVRHPQ
jgi:hydrogenase/urease accessory protein HupE